MESNLIVENILNNFWFEKINSEVIETNQEDEVNQLLKYIYEFQQGNFGCKDEFAEFFLNASDDDVFIVGMRLFMAIANHKDFGLLEKFLEESEEDEIRVFLAYVYESLSLQAIPYLLALHEEWEETEVGEDIARTICSMLGVRYNADEICDTEDLADIYMDFAKDHDLHKYYYDGEEFFSGNLTKLIIRVATDCKNRNISFYTDQPSSILSNSFGVMCPISYGTIIDDDKIKEVYDYVTKISVIQQEKGVKYFYGHEV